jgi:hypothetical protein
VASAIEIQIQADARTACAIDNCIENSDARSLVTQGK